MRIGVDFGKMQFKVDGQIVNLHIWDTPGQKEYNSLSRSYFKKSNCVFLFYDITDEKTFANLKNWIKELKENIKS